MGLKIGAPKLKNEYRLFQAEAYSRGWLPNLTSPAGGIRVESRQVQKGKTVGEFPPWMKNLLATVSHGN